MQSSPWRIDGHTARLESEKFRAEIDLSNPSAGVRHLEARGMALPDAALFCVMLPQFFAASSIGEAPAAGSSAPGGEESATDILSRGNCVAGSQARGLTYCETAIDFYSRGNDLVAIYGDAREHPFRAQIYWRLLPSSRFDSVDGKKQSIAALELILSIQTSLLNSDPALTVETTLAANEVSQLADVDGFGFVDLPIPSAPELADAQPGAGCFVLGPASGSLTYIEMVHPADFRHSTLERINQNGPVRISHRLFVERLEKGVILRSRIRAIFATADANPATIARAYHEFAASDPPLTA
jgi:hypothetical protein